jgi:hypothetical protein
LRVPAEYRQQRCQGQHDQQCGANPIDLLPTHSITSLSTGRHGFAIAICPGFFWPLLDILISRSCTGMRNPGEERNRGYHHFTGNRVARWNRFIDPGQVSYSPNA